MDIAGLETLIKILLANQNENRHEILIVNLQKNVIVYIV